MGWLAKHSLLAWPTKAFAQLPAKIRLEVRAKVMSSFSALVSGHARVQEVLPFSGVRVEGSSLYSLILRPFGLHQGSKFS